MRLGPALIALIAHTAAASGADPRARVQLDVTLSGQIVAGSEGLGYFVPEVARAVAEGMRHGGAAVAGPSEAPPVASGVTPVVISIEERAGDRVMLTAHVREHKVEIEGAVEHIDRLVGQLVERLLPLCAEGSAPAVSAPANLAPAHGPRGAATKAVAAPVKSTLAVPAESSPVATGTPPSATPPPLVSTPTPPGVVPPPLVGVAPATGRAPPPLTPTPTAAPLEPDGADARTVESPQPLLTAAPSDRGFVRGRVVVHAIPEPAGGYAGAGTAATQALYAVLQRRLRLSVVPMGVGMTALSTAAEEGARAQARTVVMARVDAFSLGVDPSAGTAAPSGVLARMRLELAVVREGRLILRKTVLAEIPAHVDQRGRLDPVYLAVTRALEGMLAELTPSLSGDAR